MALGTLDGMAAGGMVDLVGGGFHRYSVDERWLVPHFEKMLYDNALLASVYLHAAKRLAPPAKRGGRPAETSDARPPNPLSRSAARPRTPPKSVRNIAV